MCGGIGHDPVVPTRHFELVAVSFELGSKLFHFGRGLVVLLHLPPTNKTVHVESRYLFGQSVFILAYLDGRFGDLYPHNFQSPI